MDEVDEVDALFKEYDTLRQESLDSMQNRTQIVAFGLGTLAVLAGAVLSRDAVSSQLIIAVFCIGLPVIGALALYIWLGEVERMMRAGKHIQQLELRINGIFNTTVLTWETRLRSTGSLQMKYSYAVVIALFAGSALFAPWVGLAAGALPICSYWLGVVPGSLVGCGVLAHTFVKSRSFQ